MQFSREVPPEVSMIPEIKPGVPAVVLAPMEGVTDAPMRALLTEIGGFSYCVSEFVRVSQDVLPKKVFRAFVPELYQGARTPAGVGVQIQILGGNPERMALSALQAVEAGARSIDLNFGCPSPQVNGNDGGAALLKCPDRIQGIVRAVRDALPREIPVSAKLRLGWDSLDAIHENARQAELGGAAWITIHARTKVQGYAPPAHWHKIAEVRRELSVPVVANGEIWSVEDFDRCREITGCEHFMIGRGAVADPLLGRKIARRLGLLPLVQINSGAGAGVSEAKLLPETLEEELEWPKLIRRFVDLSIPFSGDGANRYIPKRIKQWLKMRHLKWPMPCFDQVKLADSYEQIEEIVHAAYT